jgi:hypothetical protein
MVLHTIGIRRRLTLAAALLGICFNATFMVWHAVGRLALAPEAARLAADLGIICQDWGQRSRSSTNRVPDSPSVPSGSDVAPCPICQAMPPPLAALSAPHCITPPVPRTTRIRYCEAPGCVTANSVPQPRNRGPPSFT